MDRKTRNHHWLGRMFYRDYFGENVMDKNKGKYHKIYLDDFNKAKERLSGLNGVLSWGVHDYEAFIFKSKNIHLIFYPHKTSCGHHHIRVRKGSKTSEADFVECLGLLYEFSSTFTGKNHHNIKIVSMIQKGQL